MPFALSFSTKVWLVIGLSSASAAYFYYEYRSRRAEEQIIKYKIAQFESPDVYTQKTAIEGVLERVSKDKGLLSTLCTTQDGRNLQLVKRLIHSRDSETQFAAIELVCLMSEEEKNLGIIRDAGLFQALVSVLSSPGCVSDDITEAIMVAVRNCTKPTVRVVQHIVTGQLLEVTADGTRDRTDDVYDKDDEWFSRELYQLHGFESVIAKLVSQDEDIQALALEIITNYCRIWKNKEEIGELGGISCISSIFGSSSDSEVKSLALAALWHCIQLCEANKAQFIKAKPITALLSYLQAAATGSEAGQTDIRNLLYLLDLVVIDREGAAQIRKDNLIPQLITYGLSNNTEHAKYSTSILRRIAHLDKGCKEEIELRVRGGGIGGNIGVTPHRTM